MSAVEKFLGSCRPMMDALCERFKDIGIEEGLICDHVCYRTESLERYSHLKEELYKYGELSAETIVNGRMISIFNLTEKIQYKEYTIDCLELPAPKEGSHYREGWEHAEFVTSTPLSEFMANYPEVSFKTSGIKKELNPEIAFKVKEIYQAKFHPEHILGVIRKENNL